ncbi:MAG: HPr family phosphocarrier protein [Lachnospiraceae bacterium]|nr:HPr family phosphocarrier protein [Lachnospiraceae bacterium]
MVEQKVEIINPSGLHMRPANILAQVAGRCTSDITISNGKRTVNPKSLLLLMSAAITCGSEVTVTCSGPDEIADLKTIVDAIQSGLGEMVQEKF